MGTSLSKCPECGCTLGFDAENECLRCPQCNGVFFLEELKKKSAYNPEQSESDSGVKGYVCENCGARIVMGESTIATKCYYCHSNIVITDRIENDYPDGIILFDVDKEQARQAFERFFAKKRFLNNRYFDKAYIDNFTGVYYPYWYFDVEGEGSFTGDGDIVHETRKGDYIITTKEHYHLDRKGFIELRNMYRKALRKADRKIIDGIHPYDMTYLRPFSAKYLTGYFAEQKNMDQSEAEREMLKEAEDHSEHLMTQDSGLSNLHGSASFMPKRYRTRYVLLPTWVMTYINKEDNQIYSYMMNGQTGKVCGRVPLNEKKLIGTSAGIDVLLLLALFLVFLFANSPNKLEVYEIFFLLLLGLPIGIYVYFHTRNKYSLKNELYHFDLSKQGTVRFTLNEREYLGEDVEKVYSPQNNNSSRHGKH